MGRNGQGRIFASEPNVPTRPSASFCGSEDTLRPGPLASSTGKPAPDLAKSWPNVRAQCRTVAWLATAPLAGISSLGRVTRASRFRMSHLIKRLGKSHDTFRHDRQWEDNIMVAQPGRIARY